MTNDNPEKVAAEKVAFAVVLVISLVAALAVVNLRSSVRLSAPVELSKSGLSVSMPQGAAWRSDGKWKFDGDGFSINSIFADSADGGGSYARCRYILADKEMTTQQRFSEYASLLNSEIVETGQMPAKGLVIDWAKISDVNGQTSNVPFEIIFGVCRLPDGRYLQIDVLTTKDEKDFTQNIFNSIVKSVAFQDNGLLDTGIRIVSRCRNNGLARTINDREKQVSLSILSDTSNRPVGFTMNAYTAEPNTGTLQDEEPASESEIDIAGYFYKRGRASQEEVGLFHADNAFTKFTWKVETRTGIKARRLEMSAEDQNLIIDRQDSEKQYTLSKAAVPEIITDTALKTLLDSNQNAFIIDVIGSDGTITPLYAEKVEPAKNGDMIVKAELLNGHGIRRQLYYDKSKNLIKTAFENDTVLTPATAEEIAGQFPERASMVLNSRQLLNRQEL